MLYMMRMYKFLGHIYTPYDSLLSDLQIHETILRLRNDMILHPWNEGQLLSKVTPVVRTTRTLIYSFKWVRCTTAQLEQPVIIWRNQWKLQAQTAWESYAQHHAEHTIRIINCVKASPIADLRSTLTFPNIRKKLMPEISTIESEVILFRVV